MRGGVTYFLTLLSIGALYFGSLYFVSRPSIQSVNVDLIEPLEELVVVETAPIIEYTTVDIKSSCKLSSSNAKKEKAVIVVLVRNNELNPMRRTMREFEE